MLEQFVLKSEEIAQIDARYKLKINKSVKSLPLEYTLKDYDHISDLLFAKH